MRGIGTIMDGALYRFELERYGPALARIELWREATARATRIADRLAPMKYHHHVGRFRLENGSAAFVGLSREYHRERAVHLMILEYARDQILAKLERRVEVARHIGEYR